MLEELDVGFEVEYSWVGMATQEPNLKRAKWSAARVNQPQPFTTPKGKKRDAPMERVCFVLQVKPDRIEEYKERHRSVWPEMLAALRETGWTNYSLFLRPDGLLIGYLETQDFERARKEIARRDVNKRWQTQMANFFVEDNGLLPDQTIVSLEEIFHL